MAILSLPSRGIQKWEAIIQVRRRVKTFQNYVLDAHVKVFLHKRYVMPADTRIPTKSESMSKSL